MLQNQEKIMVSRINKVDDTIILQINSLLDDGAVWDIYQGNRYLENHDNILLLAYWDGNIAGFLTGHRLQRFDIRKAEVLLYEIGVKEDFRKRGIGRELINTLKTWAKEIGADEIWVLTNKSNVSAVAMYTSLGGISTNSDDQMFEFKIDN